MSMLLLQFAAHVGAVTDSLLVALNGLAAQWPLLGMFAQINTSAIDPQIRAFLDFIQKILILPALGLTVWSAWCFHENKIRDGVLSLVGAFLCAVAVPIVKALFGY